MRRLLFFINCASLFGAIILYSGGFLLTRQEIKRSSRCTGSCRDSLFRIQQFQRLIVIVIDAWHHGFMTAINMPATWKLLHSGRTAISCSFVADAPTTTMQRLKALTTGSLPTFIDAGSNFGGSEIQEDSWLAQAILTGFNMTFLGDDTWISLYPNKFSRAYPFPSFDVFDLETVDSGILSHLKSEIQKPDWSVLIAHFLGVDHAGHRYGRNHPELVRKLLQMDSVIHDTVFWMKNDDVLFVIGDHGMTKSGDHGGDSADEIEAGILVYSPKLDLPSNRCREPYQQVDFVPTVSLLLGIPVPFSNLGKVMDELFSDQARKDACAINLAQVTRYASAYFGVEVPNQELRKLLVDADLLDQNLDANEFCGSALAIMRGILDQFRSIWTQFDTPTMLTGIFCLCISAALLMCDLLRNVTLHDWTLLLGNCLNLAIVISGILFPQFNHLIVIAAGGAILVVGIIFVRIVLQKYSYIKENTEFNWNNLLLCSSATLLYACCSFSDNLIVHEDTVLRFILVTLLVIEWLAASRIAIRKCSFSKWRLTKVSCSILCAGFCVRVGEFWNRCREEQGPGCSPSLYALTVHAVRHLDVMPARFTCSMCGLVIIFGLAMLYLRHNGALHRENIMAIVFVKAGFLCLSGLVAFHWFISAWVPVILVEKHPYSLKYCLPQLFYLLTLMAVLMYFWDPSFVCIIDPKQLTKQIAIRKLTGHFNITGLTAPQIYQRFFLKWRNSPFGCQNSSMIAFGLPACFTCSWIVILYLITLLLMLLLGDGMALSLAFGILTVVCAMELHSYSRNLERGLVFLTCLSGHLFYAFGHHATFGSIPWDPAFIGVPPALRYVPIQAALIGINVFASHILCAFIVPLWAAWDGHVRKLGVFGLSKDKSERTEVDLLTSDAFEQRVLKFFKIYILCHAFKALASVLASAILRRHLMTWKIFAPKFLFDGIGFFVTLGCCILVYCIFLRVRKTLVVVVRNLDIVKAD